MQEEASNGTTANFRLATDSFNKILLSQFTKGYYSVFVIVNLPSPESFSDQHKDIAPSTYQY